MNVNMNRVEDVLPAFGNRCVLYCHAMVYWKGKNDDRDRRVDSYYAQIIYIQYKMFYLCRFVILTATVCAQSFRNFIFQNLTLKFLKHHKKNHDHVTFLQPKTRKVSQKF